MPAAVNDRRLLEAVLRLLADAGAPCWAFGGWAEELHALRAPAPHGDIDLLYPAETFAVVDDLIARRGLAEIAAKRLAHKRAFELDGVMVELFLVGRDHRGLFTSFRGRVRHDWPADLLTVAAGLPAASPRALAGYRAAHATLHPSP